VRVASGTAEDDDERILARAKSGDPAACRAIVAAHQGRVFAQLGGMLRPVGRGAWVEDLAQETFLRAFRALPRFEGPSGNLRAWLLTIATRVALNELRRRPSTFEELDTVAEHRIDAEQPSSSVPPGRMIGRGLEAAVRDLPDVYRAAFLLRELHGLEYAEIASALEVDLGTVKSRLSRARARLRAALLEVSNDEG